MKQSVAYPRATVCRWFMTAAVLMLLAACSSIKVVETWHGSVPAGHPYRKIMIVGLAHDENLRQMSENVMVQELGRGGVSAVASHTLVKEIDSASRNDVVAAVRKVGADAVLSIRAVSKGDTKVSRGGETGGIYGTAMNTGGTVIAGARTYSLATLQTNLYDSETAKLVWSATVSTFDAGNVARVSRDLAKFFLENLRRDGFL